MTAFFLAYLPDAFLNYGLGNLADYHVIWFGLSGLLGEKIPGIAVFCPSRCSTSSSTFSVTASCANLWSMCSAGDDFSSHFGLAYSILTLCESL